MTLETKYEYIYYTVIVTEQWRRGNEDIWGDAGFTWQNACKFINTKFEKNEDDNTFNFRVENAHYCDNIDDWRRSVIRNKERPVFVQFQDDQQIMTTGEGCMFILYEKDDDDDESYYIRPDSNIYNRVDGLAGAGGRI